MRLKKAGVLMVAGLLSACSRTTSVRQPRNFLEQSIHFSEVTEARETYPIDGVPDSAEIDLNSVIDVKIRAKTTEAVGIAPLRDSEFQLKEALVRLAEVIDARTKAVTAHEATLSIAPKELANSDHFKAFTTAAGAYGKVENAFYELPIWKGKTFTTHQKNEALEDPTFQLLGALLQARLDDAQRALKDAVVESRQQAVLRIEAFLESPGASPAPVHLEGYDSLEQRVVEARGKDAWTLSETERARLNQQIQTVAQLARQAEKIRTGEERLSTALLDAGNSAAARLPELQRRLEPLIAKDWRAFLDDFEHSLAAFQVHLSSGARALPAGERARFSEMAAKLSHSASQPVPQEELRAIAHSIEGLQQTWKTAQPEDVIPLVDRARKVLEEAQAAVGKMRNLRSLAAEATRLAEALERRPAELSDEVWRTVRAAGADSGLQKRVRGVVQIAGEAREAVQHVANVLEFSNMRPVRTGLRVPEAIDVPLVDAPDTRIELQKTTRLENDRIYLRATLKSTQTFTAEATFVIRQFGWHTVLAPSLILARPLGAAGRGVDFKFAPAVGWLYRYHPRRSEEGRMVEAARFLQAGGGLHLTFLDHDPAKDTEIGLGFAASFWKDRLVAGVGWNLMNNSRAYVYVGSNLLPILQSLGHGGAAGAGPKP